MISVFPFGFSWDPGQNILRGRSFNFWGGGGDFEKKSCQAILNKNWIPVLTNWGEIILPQYLVGKNCCKTAWLQGSIWPVPEDQLVWFSGTSVRLIPCWKTPQNAGNSLSELQEIQNPQTPLEARTFGCRLGCLRILVIDWFAVLWRILIS
jgi:hypothetical protein